MRTKERNSGIAKKFRHIVLLVLFCLCLSCSMGMAESPEQPAYLHELEDLEQQYQAVVGVYAIDTEGPSRIMKTSASPTARRTRLCWPEPSCSTFP